jgi:hypothetical protein
MEMKSALESELAPHQKEIADIRGKHAPAITNEEQLVKDALEMAYKAISLTADSMVHYQEEIWVALQHSKTISPQVTVPQVIARLKTLNPHIAEEVEKVAAILGTEGSSKVRERSLAEFPPSKEHVKRMRPESSLVAVAFHAMVQELLDIAKGFMSINNELQEALSELR